MSTVRFIGCLHLGHASVAKYRGWDDPEKHDEYLIQEWNKVVKRKTLRTYLVM